MLCIITIKAESSSRVSNVHVSLFSPQKYASLLNFLVTQGDLYCVVLLFWFCSWKVQMNCNKLVLMISRSIMHS